MSSQRGGEVIPTIVLGISPRAARLLLDALQTFDIEDDDDLSIVKAMEKEVKEQLQDRVKAPAKKKSGRKK